MDLSRWQDVSREHFSKEIPRYDAGRPLDRFAMWAEEICTRISMEPGDRLLDVGCGTGLCTLAFAQVLSCQVIGLDPSPAMLGQAQAKGRQEHLHWVLAQAESLPFEDASCQAVFMSQVWHHLADAELAAHEFYRLLKPSGCLFVKTFSHEQLQQRWDLNEVFPELMSFMLNVYPDTTDMTALFERIGFSQVEHESYWKEGWLKPSQLLDFLENRVWSMFAYLSDEGRQRAADGLKQLVRDGDRPRRYPEVDLLVIARK